MPRREDLISNDPDTFEVGGFAVPQGPAVIVRARWNLFDYAGHIKEPVLSLLVHTEDEEGASHHQQLSAGGSHLEPVEDGLFVRRTEKDGRINKGSNAGVFLDRAKRGGFPAGRLDTEGMAALDGTWFEFESVEGSRGPSSTKARLIGVPVKMLERATARPGPVPKSGNSSALADAVMLAVAEAGGTLARAKLSAALFGKVSNTDLVQALSESFLSSGPWKFNGKEITLV